MFKNLQSKVWWNKNESENQFIYIENKNSFNKIFPVFKQKT